MFLEILRFIIRKTSPYILGLMFLAIGIFITVAIITYDERDPSFNRVTDYTSTSNFAGQLGAYIADPLIQLMGLGIFIPILHLLVLGYKTLKNERPSYLYLRIIALFIAIPLFGMTLEMLEFLVQSEHYPSGVMGWFLANELSEKISFIYAIVPAIFITFIVSAFAMNFEFYEVKAGVYFVLKYIYIFVLVIAWSFRVLFFKLKQALSKRQSLTEKESVNYPENSDSMVFEESVTPPKSFVEIVSRPKKKESKPQQQSKLKLDPNEFELPSTHLLREVPEKQKKNQLSESALAQNSKILHKVLEDFGIQGELLKIHPGPVVTLYEFEPVAGTKSSRVIGLSDDIARSMSAISARIAVISGKSSMGIELPNSHREIVYLREILESEAYQKSDEKLPLILGKSIGGESVVADLAKMPHLLVAGTTGSGKSVAINTMILSLLYKYSPDDCKLIMIDPKMLELSVYDGIPHLLAPVVTEPKKAVAALKWAVKEMENRYRMMSTVGVRNIDGFNKAVAESQKNHQVLEKKIQVGFDPESGMPKYETITIDTKKLPYIVVIVDEMADLMLVAGKEIEGSIQRLAQMARAAGIHIIMATQRPSVDVITGVIKANFPTRISFQVTSKIDSRTILGEQGAEQLLGMGDMLFMRGGGRIERVHGPFVDDKEVESITNFLRSQGTPAYVEEVTVDDSEGDASGYGEIGSSGDDLYDEAVRIVLRDKKASTSYVQRCLRIGYNRAATIIERMEKEGVVSAPNHVGKRDILLGE